MLTHYPDAPLALPIESMTLLVSGMARLHFSWYGQEVAEAPGMALLRSLASAPWFASDVTGDPCAVIAVFAPLQGKEQAFRAALHQVWRDSQYAYDHPLPVCSIENSGDDGTLLVSFAQCASVVAAHPGWTELTSLCDVTWLSKGAYQPLQPCSALLTPKPGVSEELLGLVLLAQEGYARLHSQPATFENVAQEAGSFWQSQPHTIAQFRAILNLVSLGCVVQRTGNYDFVHRDEIGSDCDTSPVRIILNGVALYNVDYCGLLVRA